MSHLLSSNDNTKFKNTHFNVLIATPAYGGNVCADFTESLLHTCETFINLNIKYQVKFINNQIVTRARNMLAHIFMENDDFTHMMFIDADIKWHPSHVLMLLEHKKDCVIGVYPNKAYYWKGDAITTNPSSKLVKESNETSTNSYLTKVEYGATGFMLLTKQALNRIKRDIDFFYLPSGNEVFKVYNYFDCNVVNNDYLTEDFYFSYLFNKNGGTIYADKRIDLLHIGSHHYGSLITNK